MPNNKKHEKRPPSELRKEISSSSHVTPMDIQSSRDHNVGRVFVDIAKQDGTKTIIVYYDPNLPRQHVDQTVKPAFREACKTCFGTKMNTEVFDLVERNQQMLPEDERVRVRVNGIEKAWNTLELHISDPEKASEYSLDVLENYFLVKFKRGLT